MPEFPRSDFRLHVGWRNIKTSVTAMLVAMVYCLIGRNPAFACIGVIFGMGTDMPDSIKNGGNRLFGTLIGGLLSIAVFWVYLHFYPQGGHSMLLAVLLGIATVILILLCQYFWPGGVQPGGVVLCIVLYSTPVETYVSYALNRILDTTIGVIVALLVNYFLPRERVVALWEGFKSASARQNKQKDGLYQKTAEPIFVIAFFERKLIRYLRRRSDRQSGQRWRCGLQRHRPSGRGSCRRSSCRSCHR